MTSSHTGTAQHPSAWFATMRWTVVQSASDPASPRAAAALETLGRAYWFPLCAFVRPHG